MGAAGSALAQAGALALLAETEDADDLLGQSAADYISAGLPFGFIIGSLSVPAEDLDNLLFRSAAPDWLRMIAESIHAADAGSDVKGDADRRLPPSLSAVNQQLYLFMALSASQDVAGEFRGPLRLLLAQLKRHPNLPHGPQGQPLAR